MPLYQRCLVSPVVASAVASAVVVASAVAFVALAVAFVALAVAFVALAVAFVASAVVVASAVAFVAFVAMYFAMMPPHQQGTDYPYQQPLVGCPYIGLRRQQEACSPALVDIDSRYQRAESSPLVIDLVCYLHLP